MSTPAKPTSSRGVDRHAVAKKEDGSAVAQEVLQKHKQFLWPSVANYYQKPLVPDRGQLQYGWDVEGRKKLGVFDGMLTVSAGHSTLKITSQVKAHVDH